MRRGGALEDACERRLIMDNRPSSAVIACNCNDFLFASICEERNGMQLSVLSALARLNVDPWEEATRLAAMPKAVAAMALASTLDRVSDRTWGPSEAEAIAARLVQLLPRRDGKARSAPTNVGVVNPMLWLVWLVLAIAICLLPPRHQATTTDVSASASNSCATCPLKSGDHSSPKTD